MKKTKIKTFFPVLAAMLIAGSAVSDTVKIAGADRYQVTVLGDVHYDTNEYHTTKAKTPKHEEKRAKNINQWQGNSQAILSAAAKASSDTAPFVIQLGDIINGDCQTVELQGIAMKTAFAVVKKYFNGKKLFSVCGNHEYWGPKGSKEIIDEAFVPLLQKELGTKKQLSGTNYAVRYGKDLYIFYDLRRTTGGAEFVRKVIAQNSDARHVFFITHLPMFPCSKGNPGWVVPDFKELIPLLAKHNAIVLCGHSHFWGHHVYQNANGKLTQFMITSMGYLWSPGTPLEKYFTSFADWKKNINPKYFTKANQWSIDNLNFFKNEDFIHYESLKRIPSGFAKIEVDGDRILGHIYTDNSGKPAETIILK